VDDGRGRPGRLTIEETDLLECGRLSQAPESKSSASVERKYAPDRTVDILHVAIDVTPDFKARTIKGVTSIRFAPIARPPAELALNAMDLQAQKKLVPQEIIELRKTVDDLKKDTKRLTDELNQVKKRLDAKPESKSVPKDKPPARTDPKTK
jgi:aminopeptidase N